MHDRLVVGFDGSDASTAALAWAGAEAELRGASVRVISSYAMPAFMDMYGMGLAAIEADELGTLQRSCETALRAAMKPVEHDHPRVGFDFDAVDRPAAQRLIAEGGHADLLVVGANGLGATKTFLLGSVIDTVLHDSPCPVAVVPAGERPVAGRVVVGIDGSRASIDALQFATDQAERSGAELCIVHAWEYPYTYTVDGIGIGRGSGFAQVDAGIVVDKAVELARERTGGAVVGELVEGGATQALLDQSASADLIVVGSRGRGGFRSMLLGSVARSVTAHAACPVIVVR